MPINPEERKEFKCHDCGVPEGQKHELGCDMERCPFCGGQLISCDCIYNHLNLFDREKYTNETYYLPPEIYHEGVSDEQWAKWAEALEEKGRIPYVRWPVLCALCGDLWPEFFRVPDEEWQRYIQPDKRRGVVCRPCYDYIKETVDRETSNIHD